MNRFRIALRAVFSAGLLTLLLYLSGPSSLIECFSRVGALEFVLLVVLCLLTLEIACYKWQRLLRHDQILCSLPKLTGLYLIGYFFNNFLPTSFGGDAARAYQLSREQGKSLEVATSIFVERFTGLLALLPLALIGLFLVPDVASRRVEGVLGAIVLCALLFASIALLAGRQGWYRRLGLPERILGWLDRIRDSCRRYVSDRATVVDLVWTSLVFQLLTVAVYYVAGRALGLDLSFAVFLAIVPLVSLLTLLPISLNGLGLREGAFVFFLTRVGTSASEALSLSLLVYGIGVLLSLAGGVVLLSSRPRRGAS